MEQEETFICRDCKGGPWPVSQSVKDASRKRGIMERCYPCMRKRGEALRADPVKGARQRDKVRTANRARRSADKDDGVSRKTLAPEVLKARRSYARKHKRALWLASLGVTEEDYEAQLAAQGGKCAVCGRTEPTQGREFFCWDHNHKTNKPRGLLCIPCNLAIAHLNESQETLLAAIAYLEYWVAEEAGYQAAALPVPE